MFDTLAVARQLAASGFARDQAEAIAKAIQRRPRAWQPRYVRPVPGRPLAEVRAEIANLDTRLSTDIAGVRTEILNGLAAGALALALSCSVLGDGWFFYTRDNQRRPGTWALAYAVMIAPPLFVHNYIELRPTDEVAASLLFMLTEVALHTHRYYRRNARRGGPRPVPRRLGCAGPFAAESSPKRG